MGQLGASSPIKAVHDETSSDKGLSVAGVDVLAAFRAHSPDSDAMATRPVQQRSRRSRRAGLEQALAAHGKAGDVYDGKRLAARYFFYHELPKTTAQFDLLVSGDRTTTDLGENWL